MTSSAIAMGLIGIALSFMPHEILNFLSAGNVAVLDAVVLQVLGALYFGFGLMNWTAKANLIGGIYGRPLAIGNLSHFVVGALALIKGYYAEQNAWVGIMTCVYIVFPVLFTIVFFRHPVKASSAPGS